jgi:hypothetical protein
MVHSGSFLKKCVRTRGGAGKGGKGGDRRLLQALGTPPSPPFAWPPETADTLFQPVFFGIFMSAFINGYHRQFLPGNQVNHAPSSPLLFTRVQIAPEIILTYLF